MRTHEPRFAADYAAASLNMIGSQLRTTEIATRVLRLPGSLPAQGVMDESVRCRS